jgi:hypothetical protein
MVILEGSGAGEPGFRILDRLQPLVTGEVDRALAGQHHVRGLFHHRPGGQDRALEALQRRDRAGAQGRAAHQAGVQLVFAIGVGRSALAGDVEAAGLQGDHGLDRDLQSRGAGGQTVARGLDQAAHVGDLDAVVMAALGSGAAVQGETKTIV